MENFAQVLVPLPLNATFTYRIPPHLADAVRAGHRVIVPFGTKKFYTGIVVALVPSAPEGFDIKDISYAIDSKPIVRHPQLKLWEWIADYYLCAEGEVFKAAIPAGLKLESETFVEINPDFELDDSTRLSEREAVVYQTLDHEGAMNIDAIASKTGLKNLHATVNGMIERGIVIVSEKLIERYRPKRELYVRPAFTRDEMSATFERVKGARKQETLLLALIEMTQKGDGKTFGEIPRAALLERAGCTPAVLKALVDKEIATVYKKEINRFAYDGAPVIELPRLTEHQSAALDSIHRSWLTHDITLLHGVTSSGKTEVYQHLIADVMRRGRQALFLVPEIALTTQLTKRLQAVFGNSVIVYHSKFS
ncbi:MAG: DEAD/DEAH box helicase family protein, partial [Muribaculaceae bacterium]|nr:DEAD/DEAH box helicase family protein [Muribaculaceae bacterium]